MRLPTNRNRPGLLFTAAALLATLLGISAVHAKSLIDSRWLDREIVVDGATGEWQDIMVKPSSAQATVGVMNDGAHLYVCLKSWNRRANFISMTQGLILRLAPKGKKAAAVGIRFPVGLDPEAEGVRPDGRPVDREAARAAGQQRMQEARATLDVLEILESGKEQGQRRAMDPTLGFEIQADMSEGMLTYELKIPLKKILEERFGLAAEPGQTVVVTFQTPRMNIEDLRDSVGIGEGGIAGGALGSGGPSGNVGSRGGSRGGVGRSGGGPGRPQGDFRSEWNEGQGLNIKTRIRLATRDVQ